MLPNFIHAGVPKAASATFELIFKTHPDVYATREKELNFFGNHKNYAKGAKWYEETYFRNTGGSPIVCDLSIGYSTGLAIDVPEQILETLGPDVKFLFVLRHPVDRAYSQYCMARFKGQLDRLSFDESIDRAMSVKDRITEHDICRVQSGSYYSDSRDLDIFRYCMYVKTGLYSNTVARFSKVFDSKNILVLFVDDIAENLAAEANKVFKFLGIEQMDVSGMKRRNESQTLRLPAIKSFANRLYSFQVVRYFLNHIISDKARRSWKRLFLSRNVAENSQVPSPDLETQKRLQKFYYADIERTQDVTGRNLADWLGKYPTK